MRISESISRRSVTDQLIPGIDLSPSTQIEGSELLER
jgi:hypothetical protein